MKSVLLGLVGAALALGASGSQTVTFSRDVAPILQKRCQTCHRPGEVAPMSLLTYTEARPWAKAIRQAVLTKRMPPWLADPRHGQFRNDFSLSEEEIRVLTAWSDAGAPEGNPQDLPTPLDFVAGWNIGQPDAVLEMPVPFQVPAQGEIDNFYIAIPTNFTEDKWVQAAEIRPGNRTLVHHVNAFIRLPNPDGTRTMQPGVPYFPPKSTGPPPSATQPVSSALVGYVPGYQWKKWEPGQAKLIPAGADLVLQLHYQPNGTPGEDQTKVGLLFAKGEVKEQVVSAVVKSWNFSIPAGEPNHPVHSSAELATDVKLVSFHPHMHYRGKDFEYRAVYPTGETEVLMRIPRWDFNWQLTYFLEKPKLLPRGTRIECTAHFDNSPNNPRNPDASVTVTYGEQSRDEMMSGWVEVAFDPDKDPKALFVVKKKGPTD